MKRLPSVREPHSLRLVPAVNLAVGDRGGRAPAEFHLVGNFLDRRPPRRSGKLRGEEDSEPVGTGVHDVGSTRRR